MTKICHTISIFQQIICCTLRRFFSTVRQRFVLSPTDEMKNLDVNTALWSIFMSVTLQAAVHLEKDYTENLRSIKNQPKKSLRQLFQVTERFITDQTEVTGLTTIDWQQPMWRETTLLIDRAVQFATARTYVFSDSVLCLGGISDEPVKAWESRIKCLLETRKIGSTESRWSSSGKFHRIHYIADSRRDSKK